LRANQIEFLNLIIDHLTEHGSMDARLLYDSPYTDFSPRGVDGVFEAKEVDELVSILDDVRKRAVGRLSLIPKSLHELADLSLHEFRSRPTRKKGRPTNLPGARLFIADFHSRS